MLNKFLSTIYCFSNWRLYYICCRVLKICLPGTYVPEDIEVIWQQNSSEALAEVTSSAVLSQSNENPAVSTGLRRPYTGLRSD